MSRHIIDQTHKPAGSARLRHYLAIERASGRSSVWDRLDRSRKGPKDASRVKQFLRVERGQNA
ncbi:hypothetical protein [Celeribacter indicus]|uniref:Uncharacterized protein n=1 Tax=Celeribacter indicus TaxID=1208324 RepID=A0A0B5E0M2_9RHOB|nr:hypothetical protein [Celeribacter indicus]AJE46017.1 hypothetical protein P73_1302 [Celeribacter indicus]SDX32935.1 hypothetical protein SAMN05443573_12218 [Celeribacter indicus]